jgi:hypothetical protein
MFTAETQRTQRELIFSFATERAANENQSACGNHEAKEIWTQFSRLG